MHFQCKWVWVSKNISHSVLHWLDLLNKWVCCHQVTTVLGACMWKHVNNEQFGWHRFHTGQVTTVTWPVWSSASANGVIGELQCVSTFWGPQCMTVGFAQGVYKQMKMLMPSRTQCYNIFAKFHTKPFCSLHWQINSWIMLSCLKWICVVILGKEPGHTCALMGKFSSLIKSKPHTRIWGFLVCTSCC